MANPIQYNQSIVGALTDANLGREEWEFDATANDYVTISIDTHDDIDSRLDLFSPDGVLIKDNDDHSGGLIAGTDSCIRIYKLTKTGKYKILARPYDASSRGSYTISLAKIPDPYVVFFTADIELDKTYQGLIQPNTGSYEPYLGFPAHFYKLNVTTTDKYTLEISADRNICAYINPIRAYIDANYMTDRSGDSPSQNFLISKMTFLGIGPYMLVVLPHRADLVTSYNFKIIRTIPIPASSIKEIGPELINWKDTIYTTSHKDPQDGKPAAYYKVMPNGKLWSFRIEADKPIKMLFFRLDETFYYGSHTASTVIEMLQVSVNYPLIIAVTSESGEETNISFNAKSVDELDVSVISGQPTFGFYSYVVDSHSPLHYQNLRKCCILKFNITDITDSVDSALVVQCHDTPINIEFYEVNGTATRLIFTSYTDTYSTYSNFKPLVGMDYYILVYPSLYYLLAFSIQVAIKKCASTQEWPDPQNIIGLDLFKVNQFSVNNLLDMHYGAGVRYLFRKFNKPYKNGLFTISDVTGMLRIKNNDIDAQTYNLLVEISDNDPEILLRYNVSNDTPVPLNIDILATIFDGISGIKTARCNDAISGIISPSSISNIEAQTGHDYIFKDELLDPKYTVSDDGGPTQELPTHKIFGLATQTDQWILFNAYSFSNDPKLNVKILESGSFGHSSSQPFYYLTLSKKDGDNAKDVIISVTGTNCEYTLKMIRAYSPVSIGKVVDGLHTIEFSSSNGKGLVKINSMTSRPVVFSSMMRGTLDNGVFTNVRDFTNSSIVSKYTNSYQGTITGRVSTLIADDEKWFLASVISKEILSGMQVKIKLILNSYDINDTPFCEITFKNIEVQEIKNTQSDKIEIRAFAKYSDEFNQINSQVNLDQNTAFILAIKGVNSVQKVRAITIDSDLPIRGKGFVSIEHDTGFTVTEVFEVDLINSRTASLIYQNYKNSIREIFDEPNATTRSVVLDATKSAYLCTTNFFSTVICLSVDNSIMTEEPTDYFAFDVFTQKNSACLTPPYDMENPTDVNSFTHEANVIQKDLFMKYIGMRVYKRGADGQFFNSATSRVSPPWQSIPVNDLNSKPISPACNYIIELTTVSPGDTIKCVVIDVTRAHYGDTFLVIRNQLRIGKP